MDPMTLLILMAQAFWWFLPAYAANPMAVLFGGGAPVDGGRCNKDGNRILGDGKTWRGLIGGTASGMFLGMAQIYLFMTYAPLAQWGYGMFPFSVWTVLLLPFGSMCGDMMGSYIKRRSGTARGEKFPGLDQYDFVLGSFLFLALLNPFALVNLFIANNHWMGTIGILLITPPLHRVINIIGYKMGKKDVPW